MAITTRSIGGWKVTLATLAMVSYLRCIAAGMPPGGINSDYRDPVAQGVIFRQNYVHAAVTGVARAAPLDRRYWPGHGWYERRKYATTGGLAVSVAVPGTSKHNLGLALDLATNQRSWLRLYGEPFGWVWPAWARRSATYEPWHFEYEEATDTKPGAGSGTSEKEWDDMATKEEIQQAVRDENVAMFKAIIDRATPQDRALADLAYDAARKIHNRELESMGKGTDSGGRSMRDWLRNVLTGGSGSTNSTVEHNALAADVRKLLEAAAAGGASVDVGALADAIVARIDLGALATAVNDDAARRMKE